MMMLISKQANKHSLAQKKEGHTLKRRKDCVSSLTRLVSLSVHSKSTIPFFIFAPDNHPKRVFRGK